MTLRQNAFLLFVLLGWQTGFAQSPETISDPTAMTPTLSEGLKNVPAAASDKPAPAQQDNAPKLERDIGDPTRMNGNFRAALEQLKSNTSAGAGNHNAASVAPLRSPLPKISLIAYIANANPANTRAMLRINEQSKMVGLGDKFNVIVENNPLIEIEVIDISKNAVTLQLKPSNDTLILR